MADLAALRRLTQRHAPQGSTGSVGSALSLATSPTESRSAIARSISALPVQGRYRL